MKLISPIDQLPSPVILYETGRWLAVYKPAGMVVEQTPYEPSLESLIGQYLKAQEKKPFIGVIHRLDRMTTGIILFAKQRQSLKQFNAIFAERLVQKEYLALVQHFPESGEGRLVHWLKKDPSSFKAIVSADNKPGFLQAALNFQALGKIGQHYLMRIKLDTGRYHQIRAQFSYIGIPLLGDIIYGSEMSLPGNRIALHAFRLSFRDPTTQEPIVLDCPPVIDEVWPDLTALLV